MTADTELVHRYLREAITDISKVIDESDYVEYSLIKVKRKLMKAEYHFAWQYMAYLAERADINIDVDLVYIQCNDGQTRHFFFDPETFDIREVEPRTGITAAKAIKKIWKILESPDDDDTRICRIVVVVEEVNES